MNSRYETIKEGMGKIFEAINILPITDEATYKEAFFLYAAILRGYK